MSASLASSSVRSLWIPRNVSHAGPGYAVIANICMVNLMHQPRPPAQVPSINIFSVARLGVMRVSHFLRHDRKMPSPLTLNDALVYALCGR